MAKKGSGKILLIYTSHVKERMRQRAISKQRVEQAIKNPEARNVAIDLKIKVRKRFGTKYLEVVYSKKTNRYVIITAYYL